MSLFRKYTGPLRTAARKQLSAVALAVDAYFNYVTMLLHGDGTNGAQNNTFLDSSTNNFTITRNGNTTQGSFSPYGSNWSNYFNGTDATLDFPNSSNFAFGTGSFTIEFWINGPLNNDKFILGGRSSIGTMHITTGGSASTAGVLRYVGTSTIVSSNVITDNTWHHCAIVRNGSSNITLYVDGVSVGTGTDTTNYTTTSGTWYISRNDLGAGNYLNAYISNFRIVKGTAVYTSAFTPSTSPLTAITNTSLLTCQSNRFIDNSASPLTITINGTPSVQRFNPFGTATAYDTSVIGGSGYFDGTGDYLNTASITIGSGNFTLEAWQYTIPNSSNYGRVFGVGGMFSSTGLGLNLNPTTMRFELVNNNTTIINPAQTYSYNAWNHLAVVRSGTTITLYINGVSQGTATNSNSLSGPIYTSAVDYLGTIYHGASYTNDLRLTNTSVYTTGFTPPTAPLTAISGTSLLLNMTNGAIFDNAMMNDLETVGNAQISTSVVKYGTGSLSFSGASDWLYSPSDLNIAFGTGDFTVEFWIYPTNWSSTYMVVLSGSATNSLWIGKNSSNFVLRAANNTDLIQYGTLPTTGTWTHIAITRSGTSAKMFYNGTQVATATTALSFVPSSFFIGQDGGGSAFAGYLDDLRITKGFARYTTTFTPPTAALPDTGPY